MRLESKTKNQILIADLEVAESFLARGKGLLGRESLSFDQALWILHCNSIHMFFMKFPIDCIFLDKSLKVKAIREDVKPGRLVLPIWGADSVVELAAGSVRRLNVSVGDQLYVGT